MEGTRRGDREEVNSGNLELLSPLRAYTLNNVILSLTGVGRSILIH